MNFCWEGALVQILWPRSGSPPRPTENAKKEYTLVWVTSDFDEQTVTWNTMPPWGLLVASSDLNGSMVGGAPILVSVTDALKESVQDGLGFMSLLISADSPILPAPSHLEYAFVNREDKYGNAPQLIVNAPQTGQVRFDKCNSFKPECSKPSSISDH